MIKSFNAYFFAYERCQLYEQKLNTFVGPPHIYNVYTNPTLRWDQEPIDTKQRVFEYKKNDILYMFF